MKGRALHASINRLQWEADCLMYRLATFVLHLVQ